MLSSAVVPVKQSPLKQRSPDATMVPVHKESPAVSNKPVIVERNQKTEPGLSQVGGLFQKCVLKVCSM